MGLKNWQENALFLKVSTIKKQLKLDADVKNRTRGAYLCLFTTLEYLVECKNEMTCKFAVTCLFMKCGVGHHI